MKTHPLGLWATLALTGLLVSACSEQWEQDVHDNLGSTCLEPVLTGQPTPREEWEANALLVYFEGEQCYSSSCSRIDDEFCEATVEGNRIMVEASLAIGVKVADGDGEIGVTCTDDCRTYFARCELPELEDGVYEVYAADAGPEDKPISTLSWPPMPDDFSCDVDG